MRISSIKYNSVENIFETFGLVACLNYTKKYACYFRRNYNNIKLENDPICSNDIIYSQETLILHNPTFCYDCFDETKLFNSISQIRFT